MAPRSAGSRRGRPVDEADEIGGISDVIARHRVALAGATAFLVAFSYVAANAIWYQPHAHGGAFFETRPINRDFASVPRLPVEPAETIIRLEPEPAGVETPQAPLPARRDAGNGAGSAAVMVPVPAPVAVPAGDPTIREVQRVLAGLKFYDGDVDGLTGPRTRQAVETYRERMGLGASAEIDRQLLDQLGIADAPGLPPVPERSPGTDLIETASAVPVAAAQGDPVVMRIQAGLKAFGNDGIEVDGVVGSRTRSAILEFQSLFGLPETGEPDSALYAKMREIGLTE